MSQLFLKTFIIPILLFIISHNLSGDETKILEELNSNVIESQLSALAKLEKMPQLKPVYIPALLGLIESSDNVKGTADAASRYAVVHKASTVLLKSGEVLVPALREMMKNESTRWKSVELLQRIGNAAVPALPELISALSDKNKHIRYLAAKTIMQFGPSAKEAVPALIICITDDHDSVREFSIKALTRIGAESKPALPSLARATNHSDIMTRIYAEDAIKKIERLIVEKNKPD